MKRSLLPLIIAAALAGCAKPAPTPDNGGGNNQTPEPEPPVYEYYISEFVSTDIPELIAYNGGEFTMTFHTVQTTKSPEIIHEYLPSEYRILVNGAVASQGSLQEDSNSIAFSIGPNYGKQQAMVEIQGARTPEEGEPQWQTLAQASQESAVMRVELDGIGSWWAKGNIVLKDGLFSLANDMTSPGLLFNWGSRYGVPAADYAGTAYGPQELSTSLDNLPTDGQTDPCKVLSPAFRLPSYADFNYLEALNYEDWSFDYVGELNGVRGVIYKGSDFFIPFAGYVNIASGVYSGAGEYVALIGLGEDIEGHGTLYAVNPDYSMIYYNMTGENLASVRCVLDSELPKYVSHSFSTGEPSDKGMNLSVETTAGEYPVYEVLAISEDGDEHEGTATDSKTTAELVIPANNAKEPLLWKIFVNRIYTGISFTQPGVKDYAWYVSHSPASSTYEAFTLNVTIDTDMDSVPVTIKGAGEDLTLYAGASNATVSFSIPENSGAARKLSIWINGADSKKTVEQGAKPEEPKGLSVEWSTGAITVKDGAYIFAEPTERGMLFRYKSQYGIQIEGTYSSSSKYPGYAYAPQKTEVAIADIAVDQIDPCSLVAPVNTWRLPTVDEMNELKAAENGTQFKADTYNSKVDGSRELIFVGGGQMKDDGTGITLPTSASYWSSSQGTADNKIGYMAWATGTKTGSFLVSSGGATKTKALQVRCVKSRN